MDVIEMLEAYKILSDQIEKLQKKKDALKEDLIRELEKGPVPVGNYEVGVRYCLTFDLDKYREQFPLTYLHFLQKKEKMIIVRGKKDEKEV